MRGGRAVSPTRPPAPGPGASPRPPRDPRAPRRHRTRRRGKTAASTCGAATISCPAATLAGCCQAAASVSRAPSSRGARAAEVGAEYPIHNICDGVFPDPSRKVQLQHPEALLGRCCLGPIWRAWVPTTPIARSRRDLQNVPKDLGLKPRKSAPGHSREAPRAPGILDPST